VPVDLAIEPELEGLLNGHDALRGADLGRQSSQQRRLTDYELI
jgi:hypothetical protein